MGPSNVEGRYDMYDGYATLTCGSSLGSSTKSDSETTRGILPHIRLRSFEEEVDLVPHSTKMPISPIPQHTFDLRW